MAPWRRALIALSSGSSPRSPSRPRRAAGPPRERPPSRPAELQDPPLEKRVTLELDRSPRAAVVAGLAEASGMPLRVAAALAGEPVGVACREQPAGEVLRQLAALYGGRWAASAAGDPPGLELIPSPETEREAGRLRERDRQRGLAALP